MLDVVNDPTAAVERRDRMAIAAAPFVHAKGEGEVPGKKARQALEAQEAQTSEDGRFAPAPPPTAALGKKAQANLDSHTAHVGTEWESLLPSNGAPS